MAVRSGRKQLGRQFSEGARQLWIRLETTGKTPIELAESVHSDRTAIWRLLFGDRKPGLKLALALEETLGIEVSLWERSPVRRFVPPAARAA